MDDAASVAADLFETWLPDTVVRLLAAPFAGDRGAGLLHEQVTVSVTRPDWPVWS
ncbi:hypothetical protein [Mycolicibacterium hassiacum]|nr:hypothetical protein [Mycolicibacterium hassiacum]MDA4084938.1 hypothetical protein [Mycolicibacterium hassiacum DSM 44199]